MNMRLAVELVLVTAFASVAFIDAATYTVGGAGARWSIPSSNGQYNIWASTTNFTVGDVLVFNFATGTHDVATVTKANYDTCEDDSPIALVTTGPASVTLNTAGMNYFICTIGSHCEGGQKLAVNVTATTSGTTPPTPSSSSPSPTGVTSPPPPAGNSATAVAGGSFLAGLVGTVVMGMIMA